MNNLEDEIRILQTAVNQLRENKAVLEQKVTELNVRVGSWYYSVVSGAILSLVLALVLIKDWFF